jgi:hypothetical protein
MAAVFNERLCDKNNFQKVPKIFKKFRWDRRLTGDPKFVLAFFFLAPGRKVTEKPIFPHLSCLEPGPFAWQAAALTAQPSTTTSIPAPCP